MEELKNRLERLEGFIKLDPNNAELIQDAARGHYQCGNHRRALELYEQLRERGALSPKLLNEMASVCLALGRWDEAAGLLREAVAQDPGVLALRFNLGFAELLAGRSAAAQPLLQAAVASEPDNPRFNYYYAVSCYQEGDNIKARQAVEKTLAAEPTHDDAQVLSGYLDLEDGILEVAGERANKAVERQPRSANGWRLQGQLAMLELDGDRAARCFRRALEIKAGDPGTQVLLGQALLMLQRARQARDELEKAVTGDPEAIAGWIGLGWACALVGDAVASRAAFERVQRIDPEDAEGPAGLAMLYLHEGRLDHAETAVRQALQLDPESATALWLQSAVAHYRGDKAFAQDSMRQFLEQHSYGPLGWSAKDMLSKVPTTPMGKKLIQKYMRLERRRQKRRTIH